MDFSNNAPRAHYRLNFIKTFHCHIPANIDPASITFPKSFIVVTTGAGKGLGFHISLAFARAGCSGIVISSRTRADLDMLKAEIGRLTQEERRRVGWAKVEFDVSSDADVKNLESEVRWKWGRIDVIVANMGAVSKYITLIESKPKTPPEMPESDFPRTLSKTRAGQGL